MSHLGRSMVSPGNVVDPDNSLALILRMEVGLGWFPDTNDQLDEVNVSKCLQKVGSLLRAIDM